MQELIKVQVKNDQQLVSGREMSNRFQKIHTMYGMEYLGIRLKTDSRFAWNEE
jgi:hypothetical protein